MNKTVLLTVNVHGIGPEAAATPDSELFGKLAHGRYAYRGGLSALLERLRQLEVRATLFWPVFEALRCRSELEQALRDGHEIASHGHAFEDHGSLSLAQEEEILSKSVELLTQVTGTAPSGFRAPTGTLSLNTLPLLEKLGFRYDSSFVDDDAPYSLAADGASQIVELPWCENLCDATHFRRRFTQDRTEAAMHEDFGSMLDADGYACLVLHPRSDIGIARAARLPILDRLVQYARDQGATFSLCREVAEQSFTSEGVFWNGRNRPGMAAVDYRRD